MIVSIRGKIQQKQPDHVVIDVGGLGYLCRITTNTFDVLPALGEAVFLLTYYHVTENNQELFAFAKDNERAMFLMLIGVSGIGPKTAIQLMSAISPDEFRRRIVAGEVGKLTALPGIGAKTARRIIVELKDKFVKLDEDDLPFEESDGGNQSVQEAVDALVALGYKAADARKAVGAAAKKEPDAELQQIIKLALGKLQ